MRKQADDKRDGLSARTQLQATVLVVESRVHHKKQCRLKGDDVVAAASTR